MHLLSQLTSNFNNKNWYYGWQNSRWSDGWWNSMQRILKIYVRRASSLYDSKMSIDYQYTMYTLSYVFRKMVLLQPVQLSLHRWRWMTRGTTGALSSAWNSDLFAYARGPHSSAGPPWTNWVHSCNQTQWFSAMSASGPLTNGRD